MDEILVDGDMRLLGDRWYAVIRNPVEAAVKEALKPLDLDVDRISFGEIPSAFSKRWQNQFIRLRKRFLMIHGDKSAGLLLLAARLRAFGLVAFKAVEVPNATEYFDEEFLILGEEKEWETDRTNTFFVHHVCADPNKPCELLVGTGFEQYPYREVLFDALAIIYFFEALECQDTGNHMAMDLLLAASNMLLDAQGFFMWREATGSDSGEPLNPAVEMAKKRHAENYALVDEAIKYWRVHIDPQLSAEKAATELTRVVPLSHKKLAEVVSTEKKKLR